MPPFLALARGGGNRWLPGFTLDACLINCHQPVRASACTRTETSAISPRPSSRYQRLPAVFLFGGLKRRDRTARIPLFHGDVVVWGGTDRLRYHGVAPLKDLPHERLGSRRINLTFRKAG